MIIKLPSASSSRASAAAVRPAPAAGPRQSLLAPSSRPRPFAVVARAKADSDNDDDDDAPPVPLGDWRAFRAKLVSSGVVSTDELEAGGSSGASGSGSGSVLGLDGGAAPPSSSASAAASSSSSSGNSGRPRPSPGNQRLLRVQNPRLADEDAWVHRLPRPERGCLLVATHDAPRILGSEALWQAVVLVVDVTAAGSVGLLLNRPTGLALARRPGGLPFEVQGAPAGMQSGFGDNRVYRGGPVAQQVLHLLHPHRLEGSQELVPGVFLGGEAAATRAVLAGELDPLDFKFFAGATLWESGQAEREVAQGAWIPVAAARPLVLKQVLQLPTPFWREVLDLLGDEEAARQISAAYSEDGPDE